MTPPDACVSQLIQDLSSGPVEREYARPYVSLPFCVLRIEFHCQARPGQLGKKPLLDGRSNIPCQPEMRTNRQVPHPSAISWYPTYAEVIGLAVT